MGRSVAAEEVNRHARQGDADTDQGVYGVTVERHHHQEDGEETENDGVEETELWEEKKIKEKWDDAPNSHIDNERKKERKQVNSISSTTTLKYSNREAVPHLFAGCY